jgi:hypothetical protein
MSVKVFCDCGAEITHEIPAYDKKTRTLDWFERNGEQCSDCAARGEIRSTGKAGLGTAGIAGFLDVLLMQ